MFRFLRCFTSFVVLLMVFALHPIKIFADGTRPLANNTAPALTKELLRRISLYPLKDYESIDRAGNIKTKLPDGTDITIIGPANILKMYEHDRKRGVHLPSDIDLDQIKIKRPTIDWKSVKDQDEKRRYQIIDLQGVKGSTWRKVFTGISNHKSSMLETEDKSPHLPPPIDFVFRDPNLERAVRDVLHKENGPLLLTDLKKVTLLNIEEYDIKDLTGIQNLFNLSVLSISNSNKKNNIADLSPIQYLTKLKILVVDSINLKDTSFIKNLKMLQYLSLKHDSLKGIGNISGLNNLLGIDISHNPGITDYSPLLNLPSLKNLTVSGNKLDGNTTNCHTLDILDQKGVKVEPKCGMDFLNLVNPAFSRSDFDTKGLMYYAHVFYENGLFPLLPYITKVKDQGWRATCQTFTDVAAMELLGMEHADYSEQAGYYFQKCIASGDGFYSTLEDGGIFVGDEKTWPYNESGCYQESYEIYKDPDGLYYPSHHSYPCSDDDSQGVKSELPENCDELSNCAWATDRKIACITYHWGSLFDPPTEIVEPDLWPFYPVFSATTGGCAFKTVLFQSFLDGAGFYVDGTVENLINTFINIKKQPIGYASFYYHDWGLKYGSGYIGNKYFDGIGMHMMQIVAYIPKEAIPFNDVSFGNEEDIPPDFVKDTDYVIIKTSWGKYSGDNGFVYAPVPMLIEPMVGLYSYRYDKDSTGFANCKKRATDGAEIPCQKDSDCPACNKCSDKACMIDIDCKVSHLPRAVSLSPGYLLFEEVNIGQQSPPQTSQLTNLGEGFLDISKVTLTGSDYSMTNTCAGTTIVPGGSCQITVIYKPTSEALQYGTVTITDNAPGSPHHLPLSPPIPAGKVVPTATEDINIPIPPPVQKTKSLR